MPKLKTTKAVAKRFKITKSGKVKSRTSGQDHFNSRESGKIKRNKRSDKIARKPLTKTVKKTINK